MNFVKKFIALLMVVLMIFSLITTTNAAVNYSDNDLINDNYKTAVDVMSAIGVFEGDNGNLYPKDTLTRAEAAKVIAYFALTKTHADRLSSVSAPFADVSADFWAAPSIAYCKNFNIVSGKGNDLYDPHGTLTGFEFAKMLLVVAGYDGNVYTGSGWDTKVNFDALQAGLLNDLNDIDLSANILREEAIQMAFNTLKADMVKFASGTNIIIGDFIVGMGGSAAKTGKTVGETLYPTLTISNVYDDDFGFNVKSWYYAGEEVAIEKGYEILVTYTANIEDVTHKQVLSVLGAVGNYSCVINGVATNSLAVRKSDEAIFASNKGDTIFLVKNDDGTKEIIIASPKVVKVTRVNKANTANERTVIAGGYKIETNDYNKDEFIFIYINGNDEIIAHTSANYIYGTVTQTNRINNTIFFDGVPYPAKTEMPVVLGEKHIAYMNNGYILLVNTDAPIELPAEYIYVYNGGELRGEYLGASGKYQIEYYDMNGTAKKMQVNPKNVFVDDQLNVGLYMVDRQNDLPILTAVENKYDINKNANAISYTFGDVKAYFTKDTKVLSIGENSVAVLSVSDKAVDYGSCWVVYHTLTNAAINEIDIIITTEEIEVITTDLYYTTGINTGSVIVDNEIYYTYDVYEVATGTKMNVISSNITAGFNTLKEVKDNIYYFKAAADKTLYEGEMTIYQTLISIGSLVDYNAEEAIIIDMVNDKVLTVFELDEQENVKAYIITDEYDNIKTLIIVDY